MGQDRHYGDDQEAALQVALEQLGLPTLGVAVEDDRWRRDVVGACPHSAQSTEQIRPVAALQRWNRQRQAGIENVEDQEQAEDSDSGRFGQARQEQYSDRYRQRRRG
jgi:hypothetical protein